MTNCTEADLQAAMAGGGTVTFACDGTITLINTITNSLTLTLDGNGHNVSISGNSAVPAFEVNSNATLAIINLTIANGTSFSGEGGGTYNYGTVNATNCTFFGNSCLGFAIGFGQTMRKAARHR